VEIVPAAGAAAGTYGAGVGVAGTGVTTSVYEHAVYASVWM